MVGKTKSFYVLLVLSVLYLDLVFPIYIPYVKLFILTNGMVLFSAMPSFRRPRRGIVVFIALLCLLVISLLFTNRFYDNVSRDLANIVLLVSFIPIFYTSIKTDVQFIKFKESFSKIVFILGVIVGIIGLYKFYLLTFTGSVPAYFISDDQGIERFRIGTSLVGDYNYYALGLFFSASTVPVLISKSKSTFYRLFLLSGFLILVVNILVSGSRRGILLVALYLLGLLLIHIRSSMFKRLKLTRRRVINTVVICLVAGVLAWYGINWLSENQVTLFESNKFAELLARLETLNDADYVMSERTIRWNTALEIFNGYNPIQILIGGGFDYLSLYGLLFGKSEDYPHNFILSALLYGGIFTVIMVLTFTYVTFLEYIRSKLISKIFLMWFILGLFMLLTSKNSIFSVQFLLFLFLLPYVNFVTLYPKASDL